MDKEFSVTSNIIHNVMYGLGNSNTSTKNYFIGKIKLNTLNKIAIEKNKSPERKEPIQKKFPNGAENSELHGQRRSSRLKNKEKCCYQYILPVGRSPYISLKHCKNIENGDQIHNSGNLNIKHKMQKISQSNKGVNEQVKSRNRGPSKKDKSDSDNLLISLQDNFSRKSNKKTKESKSKSKSTSRPTMNEENDITVKKSLKPIKDINKQVKSRSCKKDKIDSNNLLRNKSNEKPKEARSQSKSTSATKMSLKPLKDKTTRLKRPTLKFLKQRKLDLEQITFKKNDDAFSCSGSYKLNNDMWKDLLNDSMDGNSFAITTPKVSDKKTAKQNVITPRTNLLNAWGNTTVTPCLNQVKRIENKQKSGALEVLYHHLRNQPKKKKTLKSSKLLQFNETKKINKKMDSRLLLLCQTQDQADLDSSMDDYFNNSAEV